MAFVEEFQKIGKTAVKVNTMFAMLKIGKTYGEIKLVLQEQIELKRNPRQNAFCQVNDFLFCN